jgi:PAS domain S-box-containing protein
MAKPKVLVVEDEGIIAADIQNTLENLGYEICGVVDSGEAAIKSAGEKHPDLILMDILLRGSVDGIEAAKIILGLYHIPVVYLSAHEDDRTIDRTKYTKPYGFVLKPFSESDLKTTLKMALFQHDSERMLQESEERYFRLTENAPDVIFRMLLPEGRYEYVSKASTDILGYTPGEFYADPSLIKRILHPDWEKYFEASWEKLSEGIISPALEYRVIHKSGEPRWMNQRNVIVKDQEGKPSALEGIITDITRQKDSEATIRKQQEEYRLILDSVPAMIWYKDEYNKMLRVNKLAAAATGCSVEEMEGRYAEEFYPDEAPFYKQDDLEVIKTGKPKLGIIGRHQTGTGEKIWVKTDKIPYRDESGKIIGVIVFAHDISRMKEIEEQLLKIEHRNSIIINTIPDMLFQFDRKGRFIDFKVKEETELLVPPSEFLNKKVEEVLPGEIAQLTKHYIEKAFETNELQVFAYELPGKEELKVYEARIAVSGENEVLAMVRDITTSIQAEKSLKESQEKYRRLTQNAPVALTRLPIDKKNYEFVNDEFVRQSGYTLEEFNSLTDKQVTGLIYEEDRKHVYKVYDEWAKSGFKGVNHIIYRITNKAGKLKWLDTYHYADFDGSGKLVAINQIYIDITELKNVEESLRQSEEKFRTVAEITPVAIYMLQGTKFVYVNRYVEKISGYNLDELINSEFLQLVHPDYRDKVKQIAAARQRGEEVPGRYEIKIITKNGEEKIVEINATRFGYGEKAAILGTALDITERKNAEMALKESEEIFRTVAESMPAEIIIYQGDKFVYANPFAETLTGYKIEELLKMNFWENTNPEYRDLARERGYARQRGEEVQQRYELKINTKSGEEKWVDYSAALLTYKRKPAVLGTAIDITAAKKAEEALRTGEERYKAFIYHSSEGIYRVELDKPIETGLLVEEQLNLYYEYSYIAECNEIMAKMYGFNSSEELIGRKVDKLLIRTDPNNEEFMKKFILDGYKIVDYESHEADKNGKPVYFLNNAVGIVEDGKLLRVWGTQRDITELKKTEEKLKSSLFEKEILIKEIHHRVKNNLQIITSLIKLQSVYVKDKLSLELFNESYNRVQSMALVHQKLYQSKDLARIDFGEYTRTLVTHLAQSLGVNTKSIAVNVNADSVYLSIDTAIPCGLIINELLTNAVKHAFRKQKKGEIWVRVCLEGDMNYIEVSDNGCGLPKEIDIKNLQSFGLRLVSTLSGQIKADFEAKRNNGSVFKLTFPVQKGEFES